MTEGLVTRIGKWIDNKWKVKATEEAVDQLKFDLTKAIRINGEETDERLAAMKTDIELIVKARTDDKLEKEVAELKTRMEKMELYAGMTRKIDPTKPPVVKSAFQM